MRLAREASPAFSGNLADGDLQAEAKAALRTQCLAKRAEAHQALGPKAAQQLSSHALPLLLKASTAGTIVSGYQPIRGELDPTPILTGLIDAGRRIGLPITHGRETPLSFRAWAPDDSLTSDAFGVPTPDVSHETLLPDIVLVPLVAFDSRLHRLGYGGGYYDRTLGMLRSLKPIRAFGIAYATQQIDAVPVQPWDQPLDAVLTENGIITITQDV